MKEDRKLLEIALLFLKLGLIGFGGPAVHIAMMEDEVVRRRKWISPDHFLDLVGATNLIPGPNSTEMTMHIGQERAGWRGLIVAGTCFIVPAVVITGFIAWAYQKYGELPEVKPFIYGIKPAIVAVVFSLVLSLGNKAAKNLQLVVLGIAAVMLAIIGANEIYILFGVGLIGVFIAFLGKKNSALFAIFPAFLIVPRMFELDKWSIFWIFLKIGAILYGSGYVLFAFLDAELVKRGWLSTQVLTDAIAVGQFTPGPVFSSATFVGWQLSGMSGAVAATIGIFLPSFLFVAFLNPLLPKLRASTLMSAFLDTVNVASVALILVVCIEMGLESVKDWRTILIATLGFLIAFKFPKLNTAYIIIGGAMLGYFLTLL